MTTKHTPGPWTASGNSSDYNSRIIRSDLVGMGYYGIIATATQRDSNPVHGGGIDHDTANANARLIAASPDMHAALTTIIDRLEAMAETHEKLSTWTPREHESQIYRTAAEGCRDLIRIARDSMPKS